MIKMSTQTIHRNWIPSLTKIRRRKALDGNLEDLLRIDILRAKILAEDNCVRYYTSKNLAEQMYAKALDEYHMLLNIHNNLAEFCIQQDDPDADRIIKNYTRIREKYFREFEKTREKLYHMNRIER